MDPPSRVTPGAIYEHEESLLGTWAACLNRHGNAAEELEHLAVLLDTALTERLRTTGQIRLVHARVPSGALIDTSGDYLGLNLDTLEVTMPEARHGNPSVIVPVGYRLLPQSSIYTPDRFPGRSEWRYSQGLSVLATRAALALKVLEEQRQALGAAFYAVYSALRDLVGERVVLEVVEDLIATNGQPAFEGMYNVELRGLRILPGDPAECLALGLYIAVDYDGEYVPRPAPLQVFRGDHIRLYRQAA